jgi:hypothetical protein
VTLGESLPARQHARENCIDLRHFEASRGAIRRRGLNAVHIRPTDPALQAVAFATLNGLTGVDASVIKRGDRVDLRELAQATLSSHTDE